MSNNTQSLEETVIQISKQLIEAINVDLPPVHCALRIQQPDEEIWLVRNDSGHIVLEMVVAETRLHIFDYNTDTGNVHIPCDFEDTVIDHLQNAYNYFVTSQVLSK